MTWTHVANNWGMGLREQWIFRPGAAPICALKRDGDAWTASLLDLSGVSASTTRLSSMNLHDAKLACERELRERGYRWECKNHNDAFGKTERARLRREERRFTRDQKESVIRQPASNESDIRPSRERE